MKIAFLTYNRDPSIPAVDNDGCPVTVRHYALGLGKLGHHIDIYVNKISPTSRSSLYLKKKFKEQGETLVNLAENIDVIRVNINQLPFSKDIFSTQAVADIPEIVESITNVDFFRDKKLFVYDVVCIFHPLASFGPLFLGVTPLQKTVLFPMLLSDEYKKYQSVSNIYEELETLALKSVHSVFSCSNSERELIVNKGIKSKSVKVIHRGFDDAVFFHQLKSSISSQNKIIKIICVGSIKPQKQQAQLVDVAKFLKKGGFSPVITIVGENQNFIKDEYKSYYKSILNDIRVSGLENSFVFTGSISPSKIAELFRVNDIAVFPSLGESFGKAALEAICSGIPTILNDKVSAYKDFATNNKNALFYKSTAKACFELIQRIIINPTLYSRLSHNGTQTAKKFRWKNVVLNLEKQLLKI